MLSSLFENESVNLWLFLDSRDYSHIAATGAGKSVYTSGLPVYALSDIEDSGQDILSTGFV